METKLVRVPFDVEMAKQITEGKVEGRIVTRGGRSARIICFDRKSDGDLHIVALVNIGEEEIETYMLNGMWMKEGADSLDLMLEIPEYLTFKDGDLLVNEKGNYMFLLSTKGDCKTSFYAAFMNGEISKVCNEDDLFAAYEDRIELFHKASDNQKIYFIEAMKRSTEQKAKEYLKRFFGIEEHSNSSKIGKDCEFKPFDRVLVMDDDCYDVWGADFFSHMYDDRYYCVGGIWKFCIPYEGNEHLLGTTDNP